MKKSQILSVSEPHETQKSALITAIRGFLHISYRGQNVHNADKKPITRTKSGISLSK